jgi:hypothetical protein
MSAMGEWDEALDGEVDFVNDAVGSFGPLFANAHGDFIDIGERLWVQGVTVHSGFARRASILSCRRAKALAIHQLYVAALHIVIARIEHLARFSLFCYVARHRVLNQFDSRPTAFTRDVVKLGLHGGFELYFHEFKHIAESDTEAE